MPRLAIAVALLALAALAGAMTYAGYLVVGVVSAHLGTGRLVAGFLLGLLFARLPWVSAGKLRTVGLLPKRARLPVMVALLAFCLLSFLYQGEIVPVLVLGFAASFLLTYRWIRQTILNRALSSFFKLTADPDRQNGPAKSADDTVTDVEFREKKD